MAPGADRVPVFSGAAPRPGRLLFYAVLCAVHVFAAGVFHGLRFIELNCRSGFRTQTFFEALRDRFTLEDFSAELLEIPGCTPGLLLSGLAAAELKNFHYCYENRNGEKESAEKILAALRDLTPSGEEAP